MQQDYFGFKRDKGGATHQAPAGYTPSSYWSMYASSFAQDGSEDQLIAALTKSVPDAWLKANGFADPDTMPDPDSTSGKLFRPESGYRPTSQEDLDRGTDYYLESYTKGLQSRLRNDFKNQRKGMEAQGSANLRSTAEDALGDEFKSIDAGANSRGLLYSGKRDAARASAASQKAGELGQATTDYLQSISDMGRNLNSDIFASELETSARQADINDLVSGSFARKLSNNIDSSRAQAQAAQSLGSGIGDIGGALAGRLRRKQGSAT